MNSIIYIDLVTYPVDGTDNQIRTMGPAINAINHYLLVPTDKVEKILLEIANVLENNECKMLNVQ